MKWIKLSSRNKFIIWCIQLAVLITVFMLLQLKQEFKIVADLNQVFNVQQNSVIADATKQIEQQQLRQHVVLVGHKEKQHAIVQAQLFAEQLAQLSTIKVQSQFSNTPTLSDIAASYGAYKYKVISPSFAAMLAAGDETAIFNQQLSLLNEVASPWVAATFEHDPTLSLADFFTQQSLPALTLNNEQGFLIAHNEAVPSSYYYVLIYFSSQRAGLDIDSATGIVDHIANIKLSPQTELLMTGAAFFTADASSTAQNEMALYGSLSIIATLLLLCLIYRNITSVLCTLFVVAISMLYGLVALQLCFTEVNILTLVFAVTLIGIAADYSFHALTELRFSQSTAVQPLQAIRSSLLLGFITTTAGYVILMLTPLSLFKQIAIFTVAGLFGALLCVLLVYPVLSKVISAKPAPFPQFIVKLNALQQRCLHWQVGLKWQLLIAVVLLGGLFFTPQQDDPRSFYNSAAELQTQQQKIKALLGANWDSRYILLQGDTAEQTLARNEALTPLLKQWQQQGVIAQYSSISHWLPSVATQQQTQQLIYQSYDAGLFAPLQQLIGDFSLAEVNDNYLLPEQWQSMPISQLYSGQWLAHSKHYFSVIKLSEITDINTIKHDLSPYEGVAFIDKVGLVSEQLAAFRTQLVGIFLLALLGALCVFWHRYGFYHAVFAVSRPLFAMLVALVASALVFDQLTIFNYVAGVLILALGLDYCVFYAEHGCCEKITLTTVVSALSSIFVFAILIFSSTPAISQFGFTVFVGVVTVFILAPRLAQISKRIIK